jgi:hypothetical protein
MTIAGKRWQWHTTLVVYADRPFLRAGEARFATSFWYSLRTPLDAVPAAR